MRNLFLFLWRHNFFILFLVFESVCIYLISQNSNFHHATVINNTNKLVANMNQGVSSITEYVKLKNTNEALARENAAMHSLVPNVFYIDSVMKRIVNDTLYKQQYTFMVAKVINNSVNRRNNYLTLNKGSVQGVVPEMGVISAEGVVGIVKDVSEHFCSVLSVLHKDMHVSAKMKKNQYIGSLVWDGYDYRRASLKDIARHVPLAKGDTIVTSSFSAIFPEGIMIGTIEDFEAKAGDNFYSITIKLSTDFASLSHVFIVSNLMKEEQRTLEEKSEK